MPFVTAIAQAAKAVAGGIASLSTVQAAAGLTLTAGLISAGVVSVLPRKPSVAAEPPALQQPIASEGELAEARDRLKTGLEATYTGKPADVTPLSAPLTPAEAPPAEAGLVPPETQTQAKASAEPPAAAEPPPVAKAETVPLTVTPPEPRLWTALPPPDAAPAQPEPPAAATPSPPAEARLQDPKAAGSDGVAPVVTESQPLEPAPWTSTPQPDLLGKAQGMLAKGDVAGARLWLEMAAERGDAEASFRLAETYDPASLAEWGVLGMTSDPARARALYAKAMAGGVEAARARIGRLDP